MKKLCQLLNKSEDELFEYITASFKKKITKWDYFVNWEKVFNNIKPVERELNLLNYLLGKDNLEEELENLLIDYPKVANTIPLLLGIRYKSIDVLTDIENFVYTKFDFSKDNFSKEEIKSFVTFVLKSGLGELLRDRKIKNLIDYVTGVEVGLDSNGRKNRGGKVMEYLVEETIKKTANEIKINYIAQATYKKIKKAWNIDVKIDKSSRKIDFAVNKNGKLFFIEVNFYGSSGSKLKSTATEYIKMNEYWNNQGIEFIWITDGEGWKENTKPLREYFDKADYLLNLKMLEDGILKKILSM